MGFNSAFKRLTNELQLMPLDRGIMKKPRCRKPNFPLYVKTGFFLPYTQESTLLHIVSQTNPLNTSPLKQVTLPLNLRIGLQISGHPTKTLYRLATFPTDATTCAPYVITLSFTIAKINGQTVPVAVRSKAWVCGHSLAGIVGSNPAEGIDVCLLWVLCVVR